MHVYRRSSFPYSDTCALSAYYDSIVEISLQEVIMCEDSKKSCLMYIYVHFAVLVIYSRVEMKYIELRSS